MKADLNLLVIFDAVARLGSVSQAAQHLALSQPAVSHALKRLRAVTGDPLFTRAGRGLVATPRAIQMMAPVRGLVDTAEALFHPQRFYPADEARVFRIGASDYAAFALMPQVIRLLEATAPRVTVEMLPAGGQVPDQLMHGQLDVSFWGTDAPPSPNLYMPLFSEHYVGIARSDHPIFLQDNDGRVALATYLRFPHAVVSLQSPGTNAVDLALAARGLARRVGLVSHSFAGNLATLPLCNLIGSIPSRLCKRLDERLRRFDLPIVVPEYTYGLVWHPRTARLASHVWLRDLIARALAQEAALAGA